MEHVLDSTVKRTVELLENFRTTSKVVLKRIEKKDVKNTGPYFKLNSTELKLWQTSIKVVNVYSWFLYSSTFQTYS